MATADTILANARSRPPSISSRDSGTVAADVPPRDGVRGGFNGRPGDINLIICRPTVKQRRRRAAGARGPAGVETGSALKEGASRKYFPFKAERDRGGDGEIKKGKEERRTGREGAGGSQVEKNRKMSSCRLKHRGGATDRGRAGAL